MATVTFSVTANDEYTHFDAQWESADEIAFLRSHANVFYGDGETPLMALYMAIAKAYRASEVDQSPLNVDQNGLSLDDLKRIKIDLYEQGYNQGVFRKAQLVFRIFSAHEKLTHSIGAKVFDQNGLRIEAFNHGYRIMYNKKKVATEEGSGLYVPGAWVGILDVWHDAAQAEQTRRENDRNREEREAIMKELGMIE